jgi:hypothetical protein
MNDGPDLWSPGSFFRRPEWRWLRANYLAQSGRRPDRRIDDEWVDNIRHALRGNNTKNTEVILAARNIWQADTSERWLLEAMLLTDKTLENVARRCRLPVAVVAAHAEVFFAVRPMRQASDWLLVQAVKYDGVSRFEGPQQGGIWKYAALAGGSLVLEAVISGTTGSPLPKDFFEPSPLRKLKEKRMRLLARLWVKAITAETDEELAMVAELHEKLRDCSSNQPDEDDRISSTIEFLKALPALKRLARKGDRRGGKSNRRARSSSDLPLPVLSRVE